MKILQRHGLFGLAIFLALSVQAEPPAFQQDPAAARLYDLPTREAQYRALAALPAADVTYGRFGRLREVKGATGIFVPGAEKLKAGDRADVLLQKVKPMLMASGTDSLVVRSTGNVPSGDERFYNTTPVIDGVPVIDAQVNFLVDQSGQITLINSLFVPKGAASSRPYVSLHQARLKLQEHLGGLADKGSLQLGAGGSLGFWTDGGTLEAPRLVWLIDASYSQNKEFSAGKYVVDATSGEILFSRGGAHGLNRTVYSNNYLSVLTAPPASRLMWTEGNPNPQYPAALNIYNRVIYPIDAWSGRNAYAYNVLGLVANWGSPTGDGAWAIFGQDQKPYLFFSDKRSSDDDAIAHEYGHPLFFWSTSNSVEPPRERRWDEFFIGNEFWGDLSAVTTKTHRFGVNASSWEISDLRSWSNPQSRGVLFNDWYPHRFFAWPLDPARSNSTIFGYAVYLMVNGGQHRRAGATALQGPISSIQVPAAPYDDIRAVLVRGLFDIGVSQLPFTAQNFANRTTNVAAALYGSGSTVHNAVKNAWIAVGINKDCSVPPSTPLVNITPQYCKGRHDITWSWTPSVKYHGQAVTANRAWDSDYTVDVVDGTNATCKQDVLTYTRYRMRACNACGCSAWSVDQYMEYWKICQ